MAKPHHVYQIYIRTTPERLWQAITDPDMTEKYYYGSRINIEALEPGGKYNMTMNGYPVQEGEILEADPPRRLVRSVHALFSPEAAAEAPMTHIWEIEPAGDSSCRLSLTLEPFNNSEAKRTGTLLELFRPLRSRPGRIRNSGAPDHPQRRARMPSTFLQGNERFGAPVVRG